MCLCQQLCNELLSSCNSLVLNHFKKQFWLQLQIYTHPGTWILSLFRTFLNLLVFDCKCWYRKHDIVFMVHFIRYGINRKQTIQTNVDDRQCLACPDILAIKVANGSWMFTMWTWGIFPFHYIEEQLASCKRVLDPVYSITFSELLCSSDRGDKPYREQCQYL